jgi:hypothetical protein
MNLRERICGAVQYNLPHMIHDHDGRLQMPPEDAPLEERISPCVCQRDDRTPCMAIMRCANCLSKADAAIDLLRQMGIVLLEV